MPAQPVSAASTLNHDPAHVAQEQQAALMALNDQSAGGHSYESAGSLDSISTTSTAARPNEADGSLPMAAPATDELTLTSRGPAAADAGMPATPDSAPGVEKSAAAKRSPLKVIQDREREALKLRIIDDLKKLAEQMGRTPRMDEFRAVCPTPWLTFRQLFGQYRVALVEAGFEPAGYGWERTMEELFEDWAGVVKRLQKIPSSQEYRRNAKYSVRPLVDRFKKWSAVPMKMLEYAEQNPPGDEWAATLTLVREQLQVKGVDACTLMQRGYPREAEPKTGRAVCGRRIHVPGMAFAPVNEMGVMCLFVALAQRLGYEVLSVQREFPDCEALRKLANGLWQRWIIEFEFESKEFVKHGHDARNCDMIVCWKHNWKDCPVEVLELESVLVQLGLIAAE